MGILSEPLFAPRRLSGTWSADELAALDALYPKHGGVGCVPLLNRSLSSIYAKARARGLSAPEGGASENFRKVVPAHVDAEPRRKRYHRPSPEHMRHAIAAHRAQVAADLARIDQAVLDACRRGPLSAIALAQKLKITQKRARSAMRRLQAAGKAREVRLPCEGRADVVGVEVCHA